MFNWVSGKKDNKDQESPKANTNDLNYYFSVVTGTDPNGDTVKEGDYVQLKGHQCLSKKYAGCVVESEATVSDNVYAYVLGRTNSDEEAQHTLLGGGSNLLIATDRGGVVRTRKCDSRLFQTIPQASVNFVTKVLKEFAADAPIVSLVAGGLVRPRAHCEIGYGSKSFKKLSFASSNDSFLAPLIVLAINEKKVTLGGVSTKDTLVHETTTYTNLVCAV